MGCHPAGNDRMSSTDMLDKDMAEKPEIWDNPSVEAEVIIFNLNPLFFLTKQSIFG
jgi:hypothetical protein